MKRNASPTQAGADGLASTLQWEEGAWAPPGSLLCPGCCSCHGAGAASSQSTRGTALALADGAVPGTAPAAGVQGPAELRGAGRSRVGLFLGGWGGDGTLLLLPWHPSGPSPGRVEGCGHIPAWHRVQHRCWQLPSLLPASPCPQGAANASHNLPDPATRCCKPAFLPAAPPPRLCGCQAPSLPLTLLQPPPGLAAPAVPQAGGAGGGAGKVPNDTSPAQRHAETAMASPSHSPGGHHHQLPWAADLGQGSACSPPSSGLARRGGVFTCFPGCGHPRTHPSTFPPWFFLPLWGRATRAGRLPAPLPGASAGPWGEAPSSPRAGGTSPGAGKVTQPRVFGGQPPSPPPTAKDPGGGGGEAPRPSRLLSAEGPLTPPSSHTSPPGRPEA